MHVPHVLPASLHVMVDGVRGHRADLHQAVVLNEDRIARQIAVYYRRNAAMEITDTYKCILNIHLTCAVRGRAVSEAVPERGEYLGAPSLPGLQR